MYRMEPPDPCDHDQWASTCEICEEERSYFEDMWADWQMEREKLGE